MKYFITGASATGFYWRQAGQETGIGGPVHKLTEALNKIPELKP